MGAIIARSSRRIVITGSTGKIGRRLSKDLAAAGHRLSLVGRSREKLEQLVQSTGLGAEEDLCTVVADLKDPEAPARIVAESISCLGGIDVVVNAVGVWDDTDPWVLDHKRWIEVLTINTIAPYRISMEAARYMGPGGLIIIFTCLSALRGHRIYSPLKPSPAYLASKAALTHITRQLADLLAGKGIRVLAIAPSWVERDFSEDLANALRASVPLRRAATLREISDLVRSIIDLDVPYLTGAILEISGGL